MIGLIFGGKIYILTTEHAVRDLCMNDVSVVLSDDHATVPCYRCACGCEVVRGDGRRGASIPQVKMR